MRDARLQSVLGARWGNFGLPPSQSAFLIHALIARHYFDGAYYPIGTSARIAEAAARELAVRRRGAGPLRGRAHPRRGRSCDWRAPEQRRSYLCPRLISDAGARPQCSKEWAAAGAIGLCQRMPSTAREAARRLKLSGLSADRLREPELNIRLGAAYLATLLRRFEGNAALALAAYNAGPQRGERSPARDSDELL